MLKMPLKQNLLAICFLWKPSSPTSAGRATSSAREKPPGTSGVCRILRGAKLHLLAKVSVCSFGLFALLIWQNYYRMKTLSVICCCADHRVGDTGGCSGCPAWHVPGLCCDTQTPLICFSATRFSVLYLPPMSSSPLNLWKKITVVSRAPCSIQGEAAVAETLANTLSPGAPREVVGAHLAL